MKSYSILRVSALILVGCCALVAVRFPAWAQVVKSIGQYNSQEFMRLALERAENALALEGNPDPSDVELSRAAYREAIRIREQEAGTLNEQARDAEYFLRNYSGGALVRSPTEFASDGDGLNDAFDMAGPAATAIYNAGKAINNFFGQPNVPPGSLPASQPGGFNAAIGGWLEGVGGSSVSDAIDNYQGSAPALLQQPPSSLQIPLGATTGGSVNTPDPNATYVLAMLSPTSSGVQRNFYINSIPDVLLYIDPPRADGYIFGLAPDNAFKSFLVPDQKGLHDKKFLVLVDDKAFPAKVGTIIHFADLGLSHEITNFGVVGLRVPRSSDLITAVEFLRGGNVALSSVAVYFARK